MRVVLVNPPSPPEFRVSRGLMGGFGMAVNPGLLYPPIELAHVAAVLEEGGFEVAIHDADALGLGVEGSRDAIVAEKPGLVLVDSSSTSLDQDLRLCREVRAGTGAPVAILGSQVTYAPGEVFENESVDLVVRGEPEHTALEIARRVESRADLRGVAGTTWRAPAADGKARIVNEPEREKIADLDQLPIPARHLLANEAYRFPGLDGPVTTVKSSRGCPLDCSFCGYTLAQGLRFRFRSPAHVLEELVDLHRRHGLRHVVFRDPIFTTRKDRVREICEGIVREKLDLEWQCETAVKTLDRPLVEAMGKAGCRHISLGVESGNVEIQRRHCGSKLLDSKKAAVDVEKCEEVFRACRDSGIETRAFCMIGFPEETPAMVEETFDLVERCDPDQVQFCAVTAYPGTPLYRMVRGDKELDYAEMTGFRALAGNEHMSAEAIEGKIREGYRRFYGRPKRIVREMASPLRLAGKVARYFTLFRKRA
jgi:anaerobic magnesium-protoporphyrin IX monomethyl ester cyclase